MLGRRNRGLANRGGIVAARPSPEGITDIALAATVQAAAARRATATAATATATDALVERADLRQAVREARTANLVVLCVDASGSMGAATRMEAAKGAALSLLLDAYQRRDRVALVTFAGDEGQVALRPTGSVEVAQSRLANLPTGGRTPLGPGLRTALDVARSARHRDPDRRPVIVVVTDGRATSAGPPPATDPTGVRAGRRCRDCQRRHRGSGRRRRGRRRPPRPRPQVGRDDGRRVHGAADLRPRPSRAVRTWSPAEGAGA